MHAQDTTAPGSLLNRTTFFIREHVSMLKLHDTFDILDPETQEKIGEAKEEISGLIKTLRLLINKAQLPTKVGVYEFAQGEQKLLFSIKRGAVFFIPKVQILNANGELVGSFKSKLFSIGVSFHILDKEGTKVGEVKGDWKGWNFRLLNGEHELGVVTKKWAGFGKELFTSADNYMISLNSTPNPAISMLLLAAGLAIDIVYKEKK